MNRRYLKNKTKKEQRSVKFLASQSQPPAQIQTVPQIQGQSRDSASPFSQPVAHTVKVRKNLPSVSAQLNKESAGERASRVSQPAAGEPKVDPSSEKFKTVDSRKASEEIDIKNKKQKSYYNAKAAPEKVEFSLRHMSLMLKTGMSLTEALGVIIEQTSDVKLLGAFNEIFEGVQQGKSLSEMMRRFPKMFSPIVISIIKVSEEIGTLERNLLFLADYIKKNYELDRKVKGALIYPFIVLGLTISEMLGVVFFILPKLEVMFASFPNIPKFSLMVVNLAKLFRENIVFVLIGGVIMFFLLSQFFKTALGRKIADKVAISFPIIKRLNVGNLLSGFCRTLGMLLETGIPISSALEITAQTTTNIYYAAALNQVSKEVKGGKTLADSMILFPKFFPISLIRVIGAGEKTGTLEENLDYMYGSYSAEVEEMANNMVTLLEPLLLIFAGMMIGLLAITIIAPIYQFSSSIN